jgi:hypothetical protein
MMRWRRFWQILGPALFVFWLFAVLAVFYVVQKPFTPETAQAVVRSALDVATATLIVGLGAALGRRILLRFGFNNLTTEGVDLIESFGSAYQLYRLRGRRRGWVPRLGGTGLF